MRVVDEPLLAAAPTAAPAGAEETPRPAPEEESPDEGARESTCRRVSLGLLDDLLHGPRRIHVVLRLILLVAAGALSLSGIPCAAYLTLPALVALVLVFVGVKMAISELYKIPVAAALLVVAGLLGLSIAASLIKARRDHARAPAPQAPESG